MSNNRFFSQEYIDNYIEKGIFPKIHDDISILIGNFARGNRAMDLGSCTGLLSLRLIKEHGFDKCIGIEGNQNYVERAVKHPLVEYHNFYVTDETLESIKNLILVNNINIVVCRRVLPEISKDNLDVIKSLGKLLYHCNVEEIALEGRVKTGNAKALLSCVNDEVKALSDYYYAHRTYKNCRLLRRIEGEF